MQEYLSPEVDMHRGRFQHVVELSLLEAVQPALLLAFLKPFAADLRATGLVLPKGAPTLSWLVELAARLNQDETDLPAALQAALADIRDLSTPAGHEEITTLARERGSPALLVNQPTSPQDLAFLAHLRDRDLFREARSRMRSLDARIFAEYDGQGDGHATRSVRPRELQRRIAEWLGERNRERRCQTWMHELRDQVVILIEHGRRSARVNQQHDVVVFDPVLHRLSVSAAFPSERELYRSLFGKLLFDSTEHFRVTRLFHSRPFREQSGRCLDASDVEGVTRVILKRVCLQSMDKRRSRQEIVADDLAEWLEVSNVQQLLRHRQMSSWTLAFQLPRDEVPREVDVWPPNQLRIDRRLAMDLVHGFLCARGFERRPDPESGPLSR